LAISQMYPVAPA